MQAEIAESGKKKGLAIDVEQIRAGIDQLRALLPGPPEFEPNMETMKASDWATVLLDPPACASRLVQIKSHFPRMDMGKV